MSENIAFTLYEQCFTIEEEAERTADRWSKGETLLGPLVGGPEYNTVLRSKDGKYYVTNRFDPRVVQWCKENNVVPEDR